MIAIYKREIKSYLKNANGLIFTALVLFMIGIYTTVYNLYSGYSNFEYAVSGAVFGFIIAVPVFTMKSLAEDKKQKTDQLLYSLPIKVSMIVSGKLFAMFSLLAVPVLISCVYPVMLNIFGNVDYKTAYTSLLGFYLLGASLITVGMFISSLTENQLIAAVLTIVSLIAMYWIDTLSALIPTAAGTSVIITVVLCILLGGLILYMSKNITTAAIVSAVGIAVVCVLCMIDITVFEGFAQKMLLCIDMFGRLDNFIYSLFDLTGILYYLSVIFVFAFLSIQSLEKKRWC